jgi:hypothetical protein
MVFSVFIQLLNYICVHTIQAKSALLNQIKNLNCFTFLAHYPYLCRPFRIFKN